MSVTRVSNSCQYTVVILTNNSETTVKKPRWISEGKRRTYTKMQIEEQKQQSGMDDRVEQRPHQPTQRKRLAHDEVHAAFRNDTRFPPILSLNEAANLAHLAPTTVKRLASEGYFRDSVRRGKPIAFWRDRFVMEVMELDKARKRIKIENQRKERSTNETC